MKFIFNLFLIFYIIYQTLEIYENEQLTNQILQYIAENSGNDKIIFSESNIFDEDKTKDIEKNIEKFTNKDDDDKSQKTILLNIDELLNENQLIDFSNDLLKNIKNNNLLDTEKNFVYILFLNNGKGIIISNHKKLDNETLGDLPDKINDSSDPNEKLTKILDFLNDKIEDDSGLSNTAKIVIIILSFIIAIIIIVIVIACLCKKNKQDAYNAVNQTSFKDNKLLDED